MEKEDITVENNVRLEREVLVLGEEGTEKLKKAHVAVFGIGGVGSYCVEALARAGVGTITIVDGDSVNETNINRQIIAVSSTVGMMKTDAAEKRIKEINPGAKVNKISTFYNKDNGDSIDFSEFDYVADAIDNVTSKIMIAEKCRDAGVPEISCMGTGNKIHPEMLERAKISKTSVCPLARVMRLELKKRNINDLEVVYSKEIPKKSGGPVGSVSFVPPVAGMIMAGKIIRVLSETEN